MVVVDEASQRAMEVANVSKDGGIVVMTTTIPDHPEAGGVEAAPSTSKGNLPRNASIVIRKATRRVSVGGSG